MTARAGLLWTSHQRDGNGNGIWKHSVLAQAQDSIASAQKSTGKCLETTERGDVEYLRGSWACGRRRPKFDKQDTSGRHHFLAICCHTLEVTSVCGVKVSNPQPRAIVGCPEGDSPRFLDHRCIILEPADTGRWIPRHFAVQFCSLPQGRCDVIHRLIKG